MLLSVKYEIQNIPGEFRMIDTSAIQIDEEVYQRGKTALVHQIVEEGWNWPKGGAITVAERINGGGFWVMDGGNRLRAAVQLKVSEISCMVFRSGGPEQEAGTFSQLNTQRLRLSGHSLQRGMVVAGNPEAIFVNNLVRQAAEYEIKCSRVETLLRKLAGKERGKDRLRAIWPIICRLYMGLKVEGQVINGLYWIEEHAIEPHTLHDNKWRSRAIKVGVNDLTFAAKKGGTLKASASGWGKGILDELNKGQKIRFRVKGDEE